MSMVTECPHCKTMFRVTPQQLQMRHGRVRCGRCMKVFDGFQNLGAESERTRVEPLGEPTAQPEGITDLEESARTPAHEEAARGRSFDEETIERGAVAVAPRFGTDDEHAAPDATPDAFTEDDTETSQERRSRHILATGCAILLFFLGLQTAYAYRVDIASRFAGLKPLMVRWCALVGCEIPLPQQPRRISIEASDLQIVDPQRPGVIRLTATLRSHATFDIGYPALDLVLTNAQEHTLARRIFLPREYLDAGHDPRAGLPPSAEMTVQLVLDATDLGAAGFRLDLLPAPQ